MIKDGVIMDDIIQNYERENPEQIKEKQSLSKIKKCILIIIAVLVTAAIVDVCGAVFFRRKSVKGRYTDMYITVDGYAPYKQENSYFEVAGVDNKNKKSKLYIQIDNMTGTLTGNVYYIEKYGDYEKYKLSVTGQSGSLFGDMDYIYFYFYPDKGKNGKIEIIGDEIEFGFYK